MTEASSAFTNFLLAQFRCASIRSRLFTAEIDSISAALNGNFVSADDAIAWAYDAGVIDLISKSSAIATLAST